MCDQEVRMRFQGIEMQLIAISTDVKWLKKIIGGLLIVLAAFLGLDVTELV